MPGKRRIDIGQVIEAQKSSWFQWSLIFWIAIAMVIEGNDVQVPGYAAPSMIPALHIDKAAFGSIFGLGFVGYMLGALLLSTLGDRFGRRRLVIAGVLVFGVFTVAGAYATTFEEALALRFIASIGLGGAIPSAIALMAEYAPSGVRATRVALMFVAYTIGSALGGFVAARWLPGHGWPIVFAIGGWSAIVLGLLLVFTLPESARFLMVTQGRTQELAAILRRLDPTLEIGADTEFYSTEEKQSGVPVKHLFLEGRAAKTIFLWIAYIANLMTLTFMVSWLPTVIHGNGLSLEVAEITTGLLQGGGAIGSLAFGWLLDRRGVIAVALGFLVAAPVVAALGSAGHAPALLMALASLAGFLVAGGQAGINALSGTIYPTYMRATGSGWAFGIGRIGSIVGPVVGGFLLSLGLATPKLFLFVAAPALCSCVALFLLRRVAGNRPQNEEPARPAPRLPIAPDTRARPS